MSAATKRTGDLLYHAMASAKRFKDGLARQFRYTHRHPTSALAARDLSEESGISYTRVGAEESHILAVPPTVGPFIRTRMHSISQGTVPERFVLEIDDGRVFGEGHVITAGNQLVSDVSRYFSQHERHWLLGIGKLPEPIEIDGTVAVLDTAGGSNYFHWTMDVVPRMDLLRNMAGRIDVFYVGAGAAFQQAWLEKLGIPRERILHATPFAHYRATRLVVPSFSNCRGIYARHVFDFTRSFHPASTSACRKIYVSRSKSRRRKITNEEELLPFLRDSGYEIHYPGSMTVDEQMELFGSASHVISPHGAELTNLIYCQPGTKVLEVFSPFYVNLCYWALSAQLSLDYGCILGTGGRRSHPPRASAQVWRNMRVDPVRFREIVSQNMP